MHSAEAMPADTLFERIRETAERHSGKIALDRNGETCTYGQLFAKAAWLAQTITELREDQGAVRINWKGQRIALLIRPGADWMAAILACWKLGAIAVPLSPKHPAEEWRYYLTDSTCSLLLLDPGLSIQEPNPNWPCPQLNWPVRDEALLQSVPANGINSLPTLPVVTPNDGAQIIYTSGSTGRPKGVLHTQGQLFSQVCSLMEAWEWQDTDHILNVLPLHHVHGIVNVYYCALASGAGITELERADPGGIWEAFTRQKATVFMAVPTIYFSLLQHYKSAMQEQQLVWTKAAASFRLMVSGSAALRPELWQEWETISGQQLLERYGMTEIGMALSNPLKGTREPGLVGKPLPGVRCRIRNAEGVVLQESDSKEQTGELEVAGPGVFSAYWNKPDATREAFDGVWFKTGDWVERRPDGVYRIAGRLSVDIIKSGGYKLSALDVEAVLCRHPEIEEVAVIGLPDEQWGQIVAAVVVPKASSHPDPKAIQEWAARFLASYKIPRRYCMVSVLPRNAMGKLVKPGLERLFTH